MFDIFPKPIPTRFGSYCQLYDTGDGGSDFGSSGGGGSGSADNNSLITSIGGDITKLGTAFIAEQGAIATTKAVAKSPNASVLVWGGVAVAALVVIVILFRK